MDINYSLTIEGSCWLLGHQVLCSIFTLQPCIIHSGKSLLVYNAVLCTMFLIIIWFYVLFLALFDYILLIGTEMW